MNSEKTSNLAYLIFTYLAVIATFWTTKKNWVSLILNQIKSSFKDTLQLPKVRVYILNTQTFEISMHVIFDEYDEHSQPKESEDTEVSTLQNVPV